jgi:hypothetical protein
MSDTQIQAARKCPEWEWNLIDALTLMEWKEHVPVPRRPVLDGQMTMGTEG